MESIGSPLFWAGFIFFVLCMLALDLGVVNRNDEVMTARKALVWTAVWVVLGLLFGAGLWMFYGVKPGLEFITGYVIEKSLSVDNIFVFVLIFNAFRVPQEHQHRVLFWGVLGAIILRMAMILAGAALVQRFHAVLYAFGAFLVYTGVKILLTKDEVEGEHPEQNAVVRWAAKAFPTTPTLEGTHFFVQREGRRLATPLFICLITVEFSDVIFALDSIPAIFAITQDPFIVFTSNIFAIMGLRSLYFLLARWVGLFRFLKPGLGIILTFVGVKMLVAFFEFHVPPAVSLTVIISVLVVSIVASILIPPSKEPLRESAVKTPETSAAAKNAP